MRPAADSKVSVQRMGSLSYRQRESTIFRGVTKTSGTNSGVENFDVQFVFCDNGTKRHPKIYGFQSAASAARAFDVLTCKRALEKSRTVSSVLASIQSLGTNHPSLDYANEQLLSLLHSQTRDDVIYALKQCAKRGYSLEPSNIMGEITSGLDASRLEAVEKERLGDVRQSYEATVKPSTDKKRKQATNNAQLTNHLGSARLSPDQQQRDLENKGQQPGEMHRQQEDKLAAILAAGLPALSPSSRHPMDSGKAADLAGFASLAAGLLRDSGSAGMNRPLTVIGSAPSNDPSSAFQQFVLQAVQGPNGGDMRVDTLSNSAVLPPLLKSEATALSPAIFESIEFVLECIRLASNTTPELSAAHDLVHIWRCLMQGRPWAQEKLHLPHWYYMGLLPSLQGCTSMSGLFSLCGHLWRSGGLSVMLAAMTGGLPQSTVISLLQNVAAAIPPMQRAAEVSPFSLHPQLQQSGTSVQHALSVLTAAMQQQQGEGGVNPPQDTASALMAAVAAANNGASGGAPAALQRLINQTLCEGKFGGARLPPSPSYLMGGQRMGGPGAWPSSHEQGFQLGSPSFSGRGGPSWSGSLSGGPQNGSAGEGAGEGNPQLTQLLHLLGGGSLQPLQASAPTGHVGQQTVGMYGTAPHLGRSSASAGALQEAVPIEGSSTMMMSSPSKHKNSREGATGFKADSGGKLVEAASRPRRKLARVDIDFLRGELPRTVRGEAGDGARSRASIKGIAAGRSYSVPAARHSSLDFDAVVEAAAAALGADADRKDEERQQQNIQGAQGQEPVSLPQQVIDLRAQDQTMAPSYNSPFLDGGLRGFGAGLPAGTAAGHGSEQAAASGGCEETDPPASPHHPILLSTRSRSLPTRPQPMKAPLTADIRVGTDKADAGKEGSREKPKVPTSTSPFEAPTALHQQPNSAFSKFQHSLQGL